MGHKDGAVDSGGVSLQVGVTSWMKRSFTNGLFTVNCVQKPCLLCGAFSGGSLLLNSASGFESCEG